MQIVITSPDADNVYTTLAEFLADNAHDEEIDARDLRFALESGDKVTLGGGAAPVITIQVDWYEHRGQLRPGDVFVANDGCLVMLDRSVPGDGTKWYVADWSHGSWGYYDGTIEPGDLVARAKNPANNRAA